MTDEEKKEDVEEKKEVAADKEGVVKCCGLSVVGFSYFLDWRA